MFYFIENLEKNIIYNESNKFFIVSSISSGIISLENFFIFYLKNNMAYMTSPFYTYKKKTFFLNFFTKHYISQMFGVKKRYRMVGRGFYLYSKNSTLYFRLGFSHVIKYVLPSGIIIRKKKRRKKNFSTIVGYDFEKISVVITTIRSFRGPNLYSKRVKGISLFNEFIPRGIRSFSKF